MATLAPSEKNIILSVSWWSPHRTGVYWVKLPSAHTPRVHARCTAGAPQHDTVPPAACWLALSGNFCILLRAFGKYSCSPMSLVDHRKLSKCAFSPPWPKHFVSLSWSHAMLAAVAKLLPPWVLEEKAQDRSRSPLQPALCHPVSPSFQPWTSTQEYLFPLQLASLSPQIV